MSSKKTSNSKNFSFIERFIEVCGSSKPGDIAQSLNISYQAAKNYLEGRLPDTKVLKSISEKTSYSINWLLTGQGEKFIKSPLSEDTLILSDQMRAFVRQICLEIISEMLSVQEKSSEQATFTLTSDKIKIEKALDQSAAFSEKVGK